MNMNNNTDAKQRFCNLLQSTERENIDYVIEDLEAAGFFSAPASCQGHGAHEGGLLEHSLNVCDTALALRKNVLESRPDLEKELPEDSVIISALLHDVCKSDLYQLSNRKKRNEIGMFETVEVYEIHDERFPAGHGEKSVINLLRSGLDLSDEEILAIRWHMGPWNLGKDDEKYYRSAGKCSPLPPLIHAADTIASALIERPAAKS